MDLSQTQLNVLNENVENRDRFLYPTPNEKKKHVKNQEFCQTLNRVSWLNLELDLLFNQEFCQTLNRVSWLNLELDLLKHLLKDPENLLEMDEDQKEVLLKDVANREKFLNPTPYQKQKNVKKQEFWHTRFHHQIDEIWGTGQNSVKYFPIRKNQWCCDGTKPNTSFLLWRPRPKNNKRRSNKRLIHGTHEMVAENFEKTPGYFLPSSSLGFYSNVQPVSEKFLEEKTTPKALSSGIYWGNQIPFPLKKMRLQNLDRVNRHTHKESCEFISLDQKDHQNERDQNQQGSLLVFPDTAQFRDNNSEKIKASPEFQSLEPEGRQEKVEQQGFQPLIVISTQENDSEQFRLISSEFPSLDHKGHQGFQSLIASSPQSKKNNSEKLKLTSPEFQRRLSLNHKGCQEKGFQPLIVSGSPSKENLSEQFKLNPRFEWPRLDQKEQNLQEGFQPFIDFSPPSKENNSEQFRLISSEFPSLPGFEEESKGFQLFRTQPKDQQVCFQPSNLLALEIFEQNKSIPKKDQAQFGEIGSDRFLNKPNFKPYRKPAL